MVRGKVFTNPHVHAIPKKNIREERLNREFAKFKLDPV